MTPPSLLGQTPDALETTLRAWFAERGQPAFRTRQVCDWVFEQRVRSFEAMTNLPMAERRALDGAFSMVEPGAETIQESRDGTTKHLWRLPDGALIESVLIPTADRLTLCLSSQAGCAMGCTFCATGWSGFHRQLDAAEIVGQYRAADRWARQRMARPITNIVYMGMGEPLANRGPLFRSLEILNGGYGVGARRITVSTVGVVPGIRALAARPEQFGLALSLHAPESDLRRTLIPLEARYPLDEIMDALEEFDRRGGQRITFEYTLIRDVNDAPELSHGVAGLARRVRAFVNLIPFNPIPYRDWQPSPPARIRAFARILEDAGVEVAVREPRGRDIDAACGQLRATHEPGAPAGARARARVSELPLPPAPPARPG